MAERPAEVALFLDFDGTLVDIAERPEAVVVDPALPGQLIRLHDRLGGAVAIVTGRTLAAVDGFLPGIGLDICGLHGLERRVGDSVSRPEPSAELRRGIDALRGRLSAAPLALVEDKEVGVAVHWRLAPEAEPLARAAIGELAARLGPAYRLQDGKAVCELVPAGAGKDGAVRTLMRDLPYRGRIPVFVGDDRTDEHGFAAVAELGGVGVKIGGGETAASRRVASPARFRDWLAAWNGRADAVLALPIS